MANQTSKPLDKNEFNQLIENMLKEDYAELTLEQFCTAMDAVHQESPEIKLCIRVKVDNGQIVAYGPDKQPLENNILRLGATEVEIQPWSEG
jgi:thymidine phosphorylase